MTTHFLKAPGTRSLKLARVLRMTEDEAGDGFNAIRWAETDGEAIAQWRELLNKDLPRSN